MPAGDIRIRSNVILVPEGKVAAGQAREAIPGDLLLELDPNAFSTRFEKQGRQFEEAMFNAPCSFCDRKIHLIARKGCDREACGVDQAFIREARANRAKGLTAIEAERRRIDAGEAATIRLREPDRPARTKVASVDEAVSRFAGIDRSWAAGAATGAAPVNDAELPDVRDALTAPLLAAGIQVDEGGYVKSPLENLLGHISVGQARRALAILERGAGDELGSGAGARPKFCSAISSSALVVNALAPWLDALGELKIGPYGGFTQLSLEHECPTGLPGTPPTLDALLTSPRVELAVESKCTEYLHARRASFQASYDGLVEKLADASWAELFRTVRDAPESFERLDVGQLVRHYLGLKRRIAAGSSARIALCYLYWEPASADPGYFGAHKEEIARFCSSVDDPSVPFLALSYSELLAQWETEDGPAWVPRHVAALKERYALG